MPLRCPACGNRDRVEECGSLWLTARIRIGPDGLPTTILAPDPGTGEVHCGRCGHAGRRPTFLPPWCTPDARPTTPDGQTWPELPRGVDPLPLTDEDRAVEAAWAIESLAP